MIVSHVAVTTNRRPREVFHTGPSHLCPEVAPKTNPSLYYWPVELSCHGCTVALKDHSSDLHVLAHLVKITYFTATHFANHATVF